MNKKQKIVGNIFAVIIFITSFTILTRSALAGIIGLCASTGLFLYCLSGKEEAAKGISFKSVLKNNIFKTILIIAAILAIISVITGIINSIQYEKQQQIRQNKERKMRSQDFQYLKSNIQIVSSRINSEERLYQKDEYLFIIVKNNGDKIACDLTMKITYYDKSGYLIGSDTVRMPQCIPKIEEKKFKILLFSEVYPYSKIDKIANFEIEPISCKTLTLIKRRIK